MVDLKMKKYEITENNLKSVTAEKNVFSYVNKCKGHLNRAYGILSKRFPKIDNMIRFSSDNKSLEIADNLLSELEDYKNELDGQDKKLVSHVKTSLNNVIYGKASNNGAGIW